MDFLENVGQRYLERKAYAAPQQLENFAKKQFKTARGGEKPIGQPPTTVPSKGGREEGMASLQKQLAEVKAEKPAKAEFGGRSELPTAAANATNSRRNERLSSTAEAEDPGLKRRQRRARRHSTAISKVATDKQETLAEVSPPQRSFIDKHHQHYEGATEPYRHSQIEGREIGSKHIQIATSTRCQRAIEGSQPDLYAIYVEEEAPRRRRACSQGVIEVRSGSGRTVYRVR